MLALTDSCVSTVGARIEFPMYFVGEERYCVRCVDSISGYEMAKKQVARGCEVHKFEFQSRLEASPRFGPPNPHHWIFRRSSFQFIIEAFHSELFAPGKRGLIHRIMITMGLV